LWTLTRAQLASLPSSEEDDHRLAEVLAERITDSRTFFGRVAGEWDFLRQELFGSGFTAEALLCLLERDVVVADLGCGTGNASELIAPLVQRVIAVDREQAMLDAAQRRLAGRDNVEFRIGELTQLPLDDGEVDLVLVFLVLHHLDEPVTAVRQIARVLREGGRALVVDMVSHDRESFRFQMGHTHLGFDESTVRGWADASGLELDDWRRLRSDTSAKGPGLFAAVLRSPAR
jgi:ArsR family transcriptional regulator